MAWTKPCTSAAGLKPEGRAGEVRGGGGVDGRGPFGSLGKEWGSVSKEPTDTMLLTTSTGHGDWTFGSGHGTFTAGTSNSGNASYTWSSIDGVALFFLHDTYPETVTVGVTDGAITATSGGATSGDDSPITFAPTGFRITNGNNSPAIIGTQVAGVQRGRPLHHNSRPWRTDTGRLFIPKTIATCGLLKLYR